MIEMLGLLRKHLDFHSLISLKSDRHLLLSLRLREEFCDFVRINLWPKLLVLSHLIHNFSLSLIVRYSIGKVFPLLDQRDELCEHFTRDRLACRG